MHWLTKLGMISLITLVAGCGTSGSNDGSPNRSASNNAPPVRAERDFTNAIQFDDGDKATIWDSFGSSDVEQIVQVNRYPVSYTHLRAHET